MLIAMSTEWVFAWKDKDGEHSSGFDILFLFFFFTYLCPDPPLVLPSIRLQLPPPPSKVLTLPRTRSTLN